MSACCNTYFYVLYRCLVTYLVLYNIARADSEEKDYVTNHFNEKTINQKQSSEKTQCANQVKIQVYYETLCPECLQFGSETLKPIIEKVGQYLNIQTYPYGKARTYEQNGRTVIQCHHGIEECYGNKLHACTLALVQNRTKALLFNSCMMCPRHNSHNSDDVAANACGKLFNIDVLLIKDCAKGCRGAQLLKYNSDKSKQVHYNNVPYILIDGKENNGDNFMYHVCAAFAKPPPPCRKMFDFQ